MRRALLIANETYLDRQIGELKSPVRDATLLADLLRKPSVGGYDVTLLTDQTSPDLRLGLQIFFDKAESEDSDLILITGHGLKDRWGSLYFATHDTRLDSLAATSLEARYLIDRMNDSPAAAQVLFIDTCYSGAVYKNTINKGIEAPITGVEFDNLDKVGKAVITATTAVQAAGEQEHAGIIQSLFTRHLIAGIADGQADRLGTGKISLNDIFSYIRKELKKDAPGQTPQPYYHGLDGNFIVALNPKYKSYALPDDILRNVKSKDRHERAISIEDIVQIAQSEPRAVDQVCRILENFSSDDSAHVRTLANQALSDLRGIDISKALKTELDLEPRLPSKDSSWSALIASIPSRAIVFLGEIIKYFGRSKRIAYQLIVPHITARAIMTTFLAFAATSAVAVLTPYILGMINGRKIQQSKPVVTDPQNGGAKIGLPSPQLENSTATAALAPESLKAAPLRINNKPEAAKEAGSASKEDVKGEVRRDDNSSTGLYKPSSGPPDYYNSNFYDFQQVNQVIISVGSDHSALDADAKSKLNVIMSDYRKIGAGQLIRLEYTLNSKSDNSMDSAIATLRGYFRGKGVAAFKIGEGAQPAGTPDALPSGTVRIIISKPVDALTPAQVVEEPDPPKN